MQGAIGGDDAVAGDDDGEGIAAIGGTDCAYGFGAAYGLR